MPAAASPLILARVTVKMQGVAVGELVWVDPRMPWIKGALSQGFLVREEGLERVVSEPGGGAAV